MNFKRIDSYAVIISALFTFSCAKQADKTSDDTDLADTWKWISTDGGIAYNIHNTPLSTGKNIDLKVTSDNKYFFYTNNALTSQGTVVLERRNCIHDHKDKIFINFSSAGDQGMMVEKLGKDNMELSDEAYDGTVSLYKRK